MRQVNHPLISSKPDLQAAMCASLFKFGLHDSLFSDVAVKILGTSYNLHRVILCANDFLMAKLAAMEDADLSHGTLEIKIFDPNVSDEAVQIVLRRLYGDFTDQVTNDNLLAVLASSYIFQDKDLHVMCHNFIRDIEFTPSNSLGFLDYASHYDHGLPTALLLRNTLIYLCREGSTSKKLRQKTFVKMDFAWFTKIVQSDAFYVASEFERFSFIMEVLKNRFPNFSDYTGAVQSMNTNVLSLGKLTQISNSSVKSRRASDRLSGASFGSLANDRANQRQSLYSEGSYESPKTKRISSFTESPYDETSRNKRVSMFESPTSASVSFAHEFATTSSPKSQRLARHSMTVDTSVADNFSVGLHGSPLSAPVSQRTGKPSVQVDMNVIAIEHIPLTSSAARKTSFANGVEQTPKPILRNSYTDNRGHYLADNRKIRRKSMLDPPTREEFFAQHAAALMMTPDQYALMSRSSGNALTSLATISGFPDMIRTGSLPATVRMKESRKSGMMRYFNDPNASFSSNDVTTNASAPPSTAAGGMAGSVPDTVESAVSLISRGLTYVHMSPEELLEYDLQVKVTELKLSKKSIDNPSPILVKTKYHPRSFLSWMLDEPVFPYDGMECPPARFSTEFSGASLGKFLKGSSEKLFSEVCFLAGSLWFLKVESSNSNVVISFGRKHSPHAPYSDMRPETLTRLRYRMVSAN
ncbi:hypothetical protein BC830DRAFT_379218 [Chytriomyces sp. MP71]|nr:hypothetical protein BC830DRAFT_379218 [Chytriomyces sp. MP71]